MKVVYLSGPCNELILTHNKNDNSTVSKVLRRKDKYLSISVDDTRGINSSPRSKGKFPDVERTLANFIRKHRHEELSDETIKEKAMAFANSVGIPDITRKVINSVWLEDFRRKVLGGNEPSPSPSSASASIAASQDGDRFDGDHEYDELHDGSGSFNVYRTSSIGATSSTASFSSNSESSGRSTRTLSPISMMSSTEDLEPSPCSIASDNDFTDSLESSNKYADEFPMKKRCLIKNESTGQYPLTATSQPSMPSTTANPNGFSSADPNPAPTQEGARIGLELVLQYFTHHTSELTTEDYAVMFKLLAQLKDKAGYHNINNSNAQPNLTGTSAPLSMPPAVSFPTGFSDMVYRKRNIDMI